MRAKQILNVVPFRAKVRLVYERFTVTPVATAFVFVALAHCIVQISLQAAAYSANTAAGRTISRILQESDVPFAFTVFEDGVLMICGNPADRTTCSPIVSVPVTANSHSVAPPGSPGDMNLATSMATFRREVNLSDLSAQCVEALNWPNMILDDARLEDVCFLVFQVWLLGISIVTILNESIPHLLAALVTHALSSIWSAFQVSRTQRYLILYREFVVRGACGGINVLNGFWGRRLDYFIPILVLNSVAFCITSVVSYKLFKVYAVQTFKRTGYLDRMNGLYSYILTFSVALQLSAFLIICAAAVQLDALFNEFLAQSLPNRTVYRVVFIHVCVWTLPWVCIGWTSFRRENRLWSNIFFFIGFAMIGAWISVIPTAAYERRFQGAPFFAALTVTSFVVLTVTLLLGALCRLNFGKGLPQYLSNQDLIDEPVFVPVALIRKRRTSTSSVASSVKHVNDTPTSSQEEMSSSGNILQNDRPPSYSLEPPGLRMPEQSFVPKSERNLSGKKHGRDTFLHSLTRSKVDRVDLMAISEEARPTVKSSTIFPPPQALTKQLENSSPDDLLLNSSLSDVSDPILPCRASTPRHLWYGHEESPWASILSSYPDVGRNDDSIAGSHHSNSTASFILSASPSSPHTVPIHHRRISANLAPQRSGSVSSHYSRPMAHRTGRIGLPTSPNCLK